MSNWNAELYMKMTNFFRIYLKLTLKYELDKFSSMVAILYL